MNVRLSLSVLAASLLAACSGATSSEPSAGATRAAESTSPSRVEGTWGFVLQASDVVGPIREQCETESGGDRARADACFAGIEAQAKKEKIRFAADAGGRMVWRSYGVDDGKEELFLEVPVELAPDGAGHVLAKIAGAAKGAQAEKFERAGVKALRVEIVDERTIAMTDPKKGRLVYTKE